MEKRIRIEDVKIRLEYDENPDTSWLGEYTDEMSDWAISRKYDAYVIDLPSDTEIPERGRSCRFFLPYAGGEEPGTSEYRKYGMQDYGRMEALNRGDWHFIGVIAEAVVSYPINTIGSRRIEQFTSGGLWGVESDSGDYIAEEARNQLGDLEGHLEIFGVDMSNFGKLADEAMDKLEV